MMRIGLISDTHGYLDEQIIENLQSCDEIWHAGDIGTIELIDKLPKEKPQKIVWGNIDGGKLRIEFKKDLIWDCEGVKVFMTHIGGYPPRYVKRVREIIDDEKPDLYICGHSHILKVMRDPKRNLLHMNPGACGHHGFHKIRTMLRFCISSGKIHDLEVIELGFRGRVQGL